MTAASQLKDYLDKRIDETVLNTALVPYTKESAKKRLFGYLSMFEHDNADTDFNIIIDKLIRCAAIRAQHHAIEKSHQRTG